MIAADPAHDAAPIAASNGAAAAPNAAQAAIEAALADLIARRFSHAVKG